MFNIIKQYVKTGKMKLFLLILLLAAVRSQHDKLIELPDVRIIGSGNEVVPHSLPFQVYLNFTGIDNTSWICGGSLLTTNYILTSGTCAFESNYVEITLGAHNVSETEPTQVQLVSEDITVHQDFKKDLATFVYENDIALVSLPESVTLTDFIQLVKLPTEDDTYVNRTGIITGWGLIDPYNSISSSSVLLSQENTIISNEECALVYYYLKDYDMCMKTVANEASPCVGDYGSPLIVDGIQIGILSQNVMYCIPGYPVVYTRVLSFLDWIKENTDFEGNNDVTTTPGLMNIF